MANLKVNTQVASESEPSPTSSSNESPPTSSIAESDYIPTTIVRSASESCAFTVSSTLSVSTLGNRSMTTPGVKFAPLPEIAPRKRKSHHQPLGVAARSQLMRQRRPGRGQGSGSSVPVWRNDDREEQRSRQAQFQARTHAQEVRHHCSNVDNHERKKKPSTDGNDDDDPILAIGKLVKGAGITLWRRMSDVSTKTKEEEKAKTKDGHRTVAKSNVPLSSILIKTSRTSSLPPFPPRHALANVIPIPNTPRLDTQPEKEDKLVNGITGDEGTLLPEPHKVTTRPLPPLPDTVSEVSVRA